MITQTFYLFSGEDIACCGTLEYYDKGYDRVNVKHEKTLQRIDRIFHTVSIKLEKIENRSNYHVI